MTNQLFFGDNLPILREYIENESVDLCYLDPPFNSSAEYNVLFKEHNGVKAVSQQWAFDDAWTWGPSAAGSYQEMVETGGQVSLALQAFYTLLGTSDMMAYLCMMAPRLVELRRVLKPTGSLYLHCDPTASHYLKMLLDAVFGATNFKNEITWKRTTLHSDSKTWSRVSDTILFYTKSATFTWNKPTTDHNPENIKENYKYADASGRRYRHDNIASPKPRPNMMYEWNGFPPPAFGWRFKKETMAKLDGEGRIWYPAHPDGSLDTTRRPKVIRYLDEVGRPVVPTIWDDIQPLHPWMKERLGYPTQKPQALLERILCASSNPGDVVLDPFCGCGTTIDAAEALNRIWVGIDVTHIAIQIIKQRLAKNHAAAQYTVTGEPQDLAGATELAAQDPYDFENWALSLVGARKADSRRGADSGIDGRLFFHDDPRQKPRQIIFSVKSGHTSVSHLRDLRGVIERERAEIGVLITLQDPTRAMLKESASGGFYTSLWGKHPRLQVLTIEELLTGKTVDYPAKSAAASTVPRKTRRKGKEIAQTEMPLLTLNEGGIKRVAEEKPSYSRRRRRA